MNESDIEDAQAVVMLRILDSLFMLNPQLTHNTVVAWLESIHAHAETESDVLDDNEIDV